MSSLFRAMFSLRVGIKSGSPSELITDEVGRGVSSETALFQIDVSGGRFCDSSNFETVDFASLAVELPYDAFSVHVSSVSQAHDES